MIDPLPELLIVRFNNFRGCPSQVSEYILGESGLDTLVTAMKFGPRFLKQDDPELVSISLRESWVPLEAGDVVVDDDLLPLSIFADAQAIDAQIVLLIDKEEISDAVRLLREH